MKHFNSVNHIKNLPDCYDKSEQSNNYKLLAINKATMEEYRADTAELYEALDIDKATGKTLDMYGEMYNQARGLATDEQYRILIKSKIVQNISCGDYKSVAKAICSVFSCKPSEVHIREVEDKPCVVELAVLPYDAINKAGLTVSQTQAIIQRLLPAGIKLDKYAFEGTFAFADSDYQATNDKGFASDDGSIKGGYLGTIEHYDNEAVLPI